MDLQALGGGLLGERHERLAHRAAVDGAADQTDGGQRPVVRGLRWWSRPPPCGPPQRHVGRAVAGEVHQRVDAREAARTCSTTEPTV